MAVALNWGSFVWVLGSMLGLLFVGDSPYGSAWGLHPRLLQSGGLDMSTSSRPFFALGLYRGP